MDDEKELWLYPEDDEKDGAPRDDSLAALALLGLIASMPMGFPTPKDVPKEVYGPDNGEAFAYGLPREYGPDNGESMLQASEKELDRLDALITPACVQYGILKDNPGKKFDDGKVFIDHTTIMLALGRAKHNDETGWVEPVEPNDDDRDWFSGVGGDIYD